MAGGRGFEVTPDALAAHARSVDGVGETVQLGIDAARRVRLGGDAYGQLCRMLPAMLEPLHDQADRVLTEAHSALDESARRLRTTGQNYSGTDRAAAARLGRTESGTL